MDQSKREVLTSLENHVNAAIRIHVSGWKSWYPAELLFPGGDANEVNRLEWIHELSLETEGISPSSRANFGLNSLTESGLPHFTRLIARYLGDRDFWKEWNGRWTAEEHRHDVVMKSYAVLTNLIDLKELEKFEFSYLEKGFRPRWTGANDTDDPYQILVYTSIQEEATYISHRNVSRDVKLSGAKNLCRILAKVAGEESRHAEFYQKVGGWVMEKDPNRALVSAMAALRRFSMPGISIPIFEDLAYVAQRSGVFTTNDFKGIVIGLIERWGIGSLNTLNSDGEKARDQIMAFPKILDRRARQLEQSPTRSLSFPFVRGGFFTL